MITRPHKLLDRWADVYSRMLDGSALGYGEGTLGRFLQGQGGGMPGARVPRGVSWPADVTLVHSFIQMHLSRRHRQLVWARYLVPGLSMAERRALYSRLTRASHEAFLKDLHEVHAMLEGALRIRGL